MAHVVRQAPWVPVVETFGDRLVLLRRRLGWSQTKAAASCGLDDGSWSNWENGSHPRDMAKVVRQIHDATGVDMPWLMWGVMPGGDGPGVATPPGGDAPADLPFAPSKCIEQQMPFEEAA